MRTRGFRLLSVLALLAVGAAATPAGAQVCAPAGTDLICEGDLLVSDLGLDLIGRIRPGASPEQANLTPLAGSPRGLAVDRYGNLFVAESVTDFVLQINIETFFPAIVTPEPNTGDDPFTVPEDLIFAPDGNLLLVEPWIRGFFSIDPVSGERRVEFAETKLVGPFEPSVPKGLAIDPDDPTRIYIADNSTARPAIYRVDLDTAFRDAVPITNPDSPGILAFPHDVGVFDPSPAPGDHFLLTTTYLNGRVVRVDPDASLAVPVAGDIVVGPPTLSQPIGIYVADKDGNGSDDTFYVADNGKDSVFEFSYDGTAATLVKTWTGYQTPWRVVRVEHLEPIERSDLLVVDSGDAAAVPPIEPGLVRLVNVELGTADAEDVTRGDLLASPRGVGVDAGAPGAPEDTSDDRYALTDVGDVSVAPDLIDVQQDGTQTAIGGSSPPLSAPNRVVVDHDGDLLVADPGAGRILRIRASDGQTETVAVGPPLLEPVALALDPDGILLVLNRRPPEMPVSEYFPLLRVNPDPAISPPADRVFPVETIAGVGDPVDIALDNPVTGEVLILDRASLDFDVDPVMGVSRVNSVTGALGDKRYVASFFADPRGIAVDLTREILVSDAGSGEPGEFPGGVIRIDPVSGDPVAIVDETTPSIVFLPFGTPEGIALDGTPPAPALDDDDHDGFGPSYDNCPASAACVGDEPGRHPCYNPGQEDANFDGEGDICQSDDPDADGWPEDQDNCPVVVDPDVHCKQPFANAPVTPSLPADDPLRDYTICPECTGLACANPDQADVNVDFIGDVCQPGDDDLGPGLGDGVPEDVDGNPGTSNPCSNSTELCDDNCPTVLNSDQLDFDLDGIGDACDDSDADGVTDDTDNCPTDPNPGQEDLDGDFLGDVCDPDVDGDLVADYLSPGVPDDNCLPGGPVCVGLACANPFQEDANEDGIGDVCQTDDPDQDGIPSTGNPSCIGGNQLACDDNCPGVPNTSQADFNSDGIGDACQDTDADGFADAADNCPAIPNPGQEDVDGDTKGDVCDDTDLDTVFDDTDNCTFVVNPGQQDGDSDGVGDACDNCPLVPNPGQENFDLDAAGDACEDSDSDSFNDDVDNCPSVPNADQANLDGDASGDLCDNCSNLVNDDQTDTDLDGYGNLCDADLNGDNVVGTPDLTLFIPTLGTQTGDAGFDPEADLNGDGVVGTPDLTRFLGRLGMPPGPSGYACKGNPPCP